MASVRETRYGTFELRIRNKLLPPKGFTRNFPTREDAVRYGEQVEALLRQGIVPTALLDEPETVKTGWPFLRCVTEYLSNETVASSDKKLLDTVRPFLAVYSTHHINYTWVESWIQKMKREDNLAPSTIRHRVGAVARCLDYMVRKHPEVLPTNPFRLLKGGYSQYNDEDKRITEANGGTAKIDEERDRRLEPEEEKRLTTVLARIPEHLTFFTLALESAMRMREIYTLTVDQVNLEQSTIYLDKTKNGDGRQVPLSSIAREALRAHMKENAEVIMGRGRRLFPWWDGSTNKENLDCVTSLVSKTFGDAFEEAKMDDFHFHDLRHEATCRLFIRTNLSDTQIAKITGHRDLRMLQRYLNLRGSELAVHLW